MGAESENNAESDVTQHAEDARWHRRLARILAANHRWEQAEKHLVHALKLEPVDADGKTRFELVAVLVRLRRRPDAIALLDVLLQENPLFVEARVNLAAQLMVAGDLVGAHHHCKQAIQTHPDCKEAHYNMNVVLRRLGKQQEAVNAYWRRLVGDIGHDIRYPASSASVDIADENNCSDDHDDDTSSVSTVVCVKWGTKYGAEYVNKLNRSIRRHSANPMQFVCLTDDPTGLDMDDIQCLTLDEGWTGWWNKAQVFSPRVLSQLPGKCVYIDLDSVIVGELADLCDFEPPERALALLKTDHMANEQRSDGYNSSLMIWRNQPGDRARWSALHDVVKEHFATISKYIYKFDHWLEVRGHMFSIDYTEAMVPDVAFVEDFFPDQIVEYKSLDEDALEPPPHARLVCFPLHPKPHEAPAQWVSKFWQ
ncbi:TPA: hypothetical protein N0F65_003437 [Lagenidium giganteum]|uniref:Tetratricopeptide repeat protein n=1 Tax=Lagenidium giganteum TaxID=4803 RepID=A0AAV2YM99_9STRA|nr:TPA: hypothetical protein N0F65_003437 [Lagenidium giganteum]